PQPAGGISRFLSVAGRFGSDRARRKRIGFGRPQAALASGKGSARHRGVATRSGYLVAFAQSLARPLAYFIARVIEALGYFLTPANAFCSGGMCSFSPIMLSFSGLMFPTTLISTACFLSQGTVTQMPSQGVSPPV